MKTQNAFRTLFNDNGVEYSFSTKEFHRFLMQYVHEKGNLADGRKYTISQCYEDLAEYANVSSETVKKWNAGHNGVGSPDLVLKIAEFFQVEYHLLLKEDKPMEERWTTHQYDIHLDETKIQTEFARVRNNRELIYASYHAVVHMLDADYEYIEFVRKQRPFGFFLDYYAASRKIVSYMDMVLGCDEALMTKVRSLVIKIGMMLQGYRGPFDTDELIQDLFGEDDDMAYELTNYNVRYCIDKIDVLKQDCVLAYFDMEKKYCIDHGIPCNYDPEVAFGKGASIWIMNIGYYDADGEFINMEAKDLADALGPLDLEIKFSPYEVHNHYMKYLIRPLFEKILSDTEKNMEE